MKKQEMSSKKTKKMKSAAETVPDAKIPSRTIPLVKRESSCVYNIEVGEKVEGMIRHLCNRIPDREWSGVLFYTVEGSFEEGLTVNCKDICLMDIGSATYTEFYTSADVAGYMVEHDLLDCHMSLVHSHAAMQTFFSSTDLSTLQEEGSDRNNFVSLIVNNAGTYTAAITRHVYAEVKNNTSYTYEMFGDGPVSGTEEGIERKECIEYFMMNVIKPEIEHKKNPLDERIDEILDKKRKTSSVIGSGESRNMSSYYQSKNTWVYDDAKEEDSRQISIPWKEKEFAEKPKTEPKSVSLNGKAFVQTLARIVTGSVTCNASKVDIDSWIANYDKVYGVMFKDIVSFSDWLAPYLEYLMTHIPGLPEDIIDDAAISVYANAIIDKIGKPKGNYSRELLDQLAFYGSDVTW